MTVGISPVHLAVTVIAVIVVIAFIGYLLFRIARGGKRRD